MQIDISNEAIYPDALVVLELNPASNEYSVYRYRNDVDGDTLAVELVFKSAVYSSIEALFLVDDEYALAVVEGSVVKVIYYYDFASNSVPSNYGITVLDKVTIVGSALITLNEGGYPTLYLA